MNQNDNKRQGTLSMVIIALLGMMIGLLLSPGRRSSMREIQGLTKLDNAMELIEHYYVEECDRDSLTEAMVQAMLSTLDPHSRYLSAEELLRERESIEGGFEGIGVILHYQGDTACVNEVMPNGPAEKAGFQPGDRLMKVDDTPIAGVGMSPEEVVRHLRGPHHSRAVITIKRYGEEGQRHLKVVRDRISTPSITYSGMLDQTTGYIRLIRFGETTYDEFRVAITSLKKQGMKDLIFDGNIDETEVGSLAEGTPMTITIGALPEYKSQAILEYISPKATDNNGANQFEIKAAVDVSSDHMIRSGYSSNAEIVLESATQVPAIEESAIEFDGDDSYVYIKTEDAKEPYERIQITTGISDGLYIEVKSGLKLGDKVRGNKIIEEK